MNSSQSEVEEAELATRDGRFKTALSPCRLFGADVALFDRTLRFGAAALWLLGFFRTTRRTGREPIARGKTWVDRAFEPRQPENNSNNKMFEPRTRPSLGWLC